MSSSITARHLRKWRWTCTIGASVALVILAHSAVWSVYWVDSGNWPRFMVSQGHVWLQLTNRLGTLTWGLPLCRPGWHRDTPSSIAPCLARYQLEQQQAGVAVSIPLWIPLAIFVLLAACLWRARVVELHVCTTCGYNLTGNVSGRCPECGSPCPPDQRTRMAAPNSKDR